MQNQILELEQKALNAFNSLSEQEREQELQDIAIMDSEESDRNPVTKYAFLCDVYEDPLSERMLPQVGAMLYYDIHKGQLFMPVQTDNFKDYETLRAEGTRFFQGLPEQEQEKMIENGKKVLQGESYDPEEYITRLYREGVAFGIPAYEYLLSIGVFCAVQQSEPVTLHTEGVCCSESLEGQGLRAFAHLSEQEQQEAYDMIAARLILVDMMEHNKPNEEKFTREEFLDNIIYKGALEYGFSSEEAILEVGKCAAALNHFNVDCFQK